MRKLISCIIFCILAALLFGLLTEFLIPKDDNRYYMLEQYLQENPEQNLHDVQIYGSCHAYTSFNPVYLQERCGVGAFVYANPSEIMPVTYLRMLEQFKKHVPKVVLVETWGINPYETYIPSEDIFGYYTENNLELLPWSFQKSEVIRDFQTLDPIAMNFPFFTYKERLLDGSLTESDFSYTFAGTKTYATGYIFSEMSSRLTNNGFKKNPSTALADYPLKQSAVSQGETAQIEADIVKYVQRIIDLCKEKGVTLIFYRAPYISRENELKKLSHLQQICADNGVQFIDLEARIPYNYGADFYDYEHLSQIGANRSTEFLMPYILAALEEAGQSIQVSDAGADLLDNGDLAAPKNQNGHSVYTGSRYTVDSWRTNMVGDTVALDPQGIKNTNQAAGIGWHLHQMVRDAQTLAGKSLTAVFDVAAFSGSGTHPRIECCDAQGAVLAGASGIMAEGVVTVACVVPEETAYIRVGFYGDERGAAGDYFILTSAKLYQGAYTEDNLPVPQNG